MKKAVCVGLIERWVLFAWLCYTCWSINRSARMMSNPPEPIWLLSSDTLSAHNLKMDIGMLVGLIVSIVIASLLTLFGRFWWRRLRLANKGFDSLRSLDRVGAAECFKVTFSSAALLPIDTCSQIKCLDNPANGNGYAPTRRCG